jgi:hypothetical protein
LPEPAPPPEQTEQRAGTRRGSSAAEADVESVVEAIKIQTDAIAALAAAVEKMSRTVSNFVFAQRGSRKWARNQGQGEVREEKVKKQAEKKKNAAATSVAAAESAGADAEDAGGANAKDMAEVTEERKKAERKEKREEKERKQAKKEKKKEVKGNHDEKNVNAEGPMSAEDIAMRESARAADVSTVGEVVSKNEGSSKWSRSLVEPGADAFWASWNQSYAVVEDAQPDAMVVGAEERDWVCVGDVSSNSSRWQEDASETAAVIAEAVVRHRLQRQGERDDLLCSVMEDAVEEMPVAEVVNYAPTVAAAVAAMAVLAMAMLAVTAKVSEAKEAAAAAVGAAEAIEAEVAATAVMAAQAVEAEAAAVKQQEWEQRCAAHCEMLARSDYNESMKWSAKCDQRITALEASVALQATAMMEMFGIQKEMHNEL